MNRRWHWRHSAHLPLGIRLNASGSGLGASIGIRGARIGVDSLGRRYSQLSVPGTGLYSRAYHGRVSHHRWTWLLWVLLTLWLVRLLLGL